jgi:HlyD family secretion protein
MKKNLIFALSLFGVLMGFAAAYYFGIERHAQPPVFKPAVSPYEKAIFANGIVESSQNSGVNINMYPEVAATIQKIAVREGQLVKAGDLLIGLDDSVQAATAHSLHMQALAAQAVLRGLKAQPRPENLEIAKAQWIQAQANLKALTDPYQKRLASHQANPDSISADVLDSAKNAMVQAETALQVAKRQLDLVAAGAWSYDLDTQSKQTAQAEQADLAAQALLSKYTLRAPVDGVVLAINANVGSYVSSQGTLNPYTQSNDPLLVMMPVGNTLSVRCYVDEILISKLPDPQHIQAQMSVRGSNQKINLTFDRVQPLVIPKIQLANQRQEKVDLRVLPVIFTFDKQQAKGVYPGQLVDVYIGQP